MEDFFINMIFFIQQVQQTVAVENKLFYMSAFKLQATFFYSDSKTYMEDISNIEASFKSIK